MNPKLTMKMVRRNCLDCSGGSRPAVIWCPSHGADGSRCEFWPFRFGMQPATFRARHGDRLLTPALMPPASIELESLPGLLDAAATGEIDLPGYHQPAVMIETKPGRKLTEEQRVALVDRLKRGKSAKEMQRAA